MSGFMHRADDAGRTDVEHNSAVHAHLRRGIHASHNLFVQQIFDPRTVDRAFTTYVTTESGVGLALVYSIAAFYFWRRRREIDARV
jgi:hypothetical protein